LGFLLVTGICRVIDIKPRHLVNPDDPVNRVISKGFLNPMEKSLVPGMVSMRIDRNNDDVEAFRDFTAPCQRVYPDVMAPNLALFSNANEITLQTAIRKIFKKAKR
jgi:hypothetical protein